MLPYHALKFNQVNPYQPVYPQFYFFEDGVIYGQENLNTHFDTQMRTVYYDPEKEQSKSWINVKSKATVWGLIAVGCATIITAICLSISV